MASKAGAIRYDSLARAQLYRGEANLEYIKMVREATDIPVIGNGDIKTVKDAVRMLEETVDAVMIGRGALETLGFSTYRPPFKGFGPPRGTDTRRNHCRFGTCQKLTALKGERRIIEMRASPDLIFETPYSKLFVGLVSSKTTGNWKLYVVLSDSLNSFKRIKNRHGITEIGLTVSFSLKTLKKIY